MACATVFEPLAPTSRDREEPEAATRVAFHRLLAWLDRGSESCGDRYLEIRRRLVAYFDRRNRIFAEDLADETFNRVARILVRDGTIDVPPQHFCYIVAKYVLLEDLRRERRDNVHRTSHFGEQDWPDTSVSDGEDPHREERLDRLEECLEHLSSEQRDLIVQYYREAGGSKIVQRRELALRLGISPNALAIRAARIRRRLEARMATFRVEGNAMIAPQMR